MPLERFESGQPVIDQRTLIHVCFGMVDEGRGASPVVSGVTQTGTLIRCRIEIDVVRDLFGDASSEPLDLFLSYQPEIEDAASEKYDREGAPDNALDLDDTDFV